MGNPRDGAAEGRLRNAILIAGPTASGKSALASALAERLGGAIVNADSMQVYAVLRILTARPGMDELARAPHHLYGHVAPSIAYSTGAYLRDAEELCGSGALAGRRPIFVGGTGLYFRALTEGLAPMPGIAPDIRRHWREELAKTGPARLHETLRDRDPEAAMRIRASDGQRLVRALEVLESSGRSILSWQEEKGTPPVDPHSALKLVIEPERGELAARISRRFDAMLEEGAIEEVRSLLALGLDPALPALKAIGVRELQAVIAGTAGLQEASEKAVSATRRYAKRQMTWFRHQTGEDWHRLSGSADALVAAATGLLGKSGAS